MAHMSATIGLLATLAQVPAAPAASLEDRAPAQLGRTPEAPTKPGPSQKPRTPAQPPPRGGAATTLRVLPRVVCGMVIVPVNPAPDPRMVKPGPSDVTFTLRVIVPPLCWD
jgi:hypothetical protein